MWIVHRMVWMWRVLLLTCGKNFKLRKRVFDQLERIALEAGRGHLVRPPDA
jgi:hypothetical protein